MNVPIKEKTMQRALNSPLRLERRAKARVSVPFKALVQGTDGAGAGFEASVVLDNLGPGGLYFRLVREVLVGSRLLVSVHMDQHVDAKAEPGLILEVYGLVKRVDCLPGGAFGVAISFSNSVLV